MPMMKSLRQTRSINKMVIVIPMRACVWGKRESLSATGIFLCCTTADQLLHSKEAGQSLHLVHFPMLIISFPGETIPCKMQLPFFALFASIMLNWKADEKRAFGHQ